MHHCNTCANCQRRSLVTATGNNTLMSGSVSWTLQLTDQCVYCNSELVPSTLGRRWFVQTLFVIPFVFASPSSHDRKL
ncbi:hypothetical protein RSAG8_01793, partial [Rhizoctonia solani AG-8 WAC10335]